MLGWFSCFPIAGPNVGRAYLGFSQKWGLAHTLSATGWCCFPMGQLTKVASTKVASLGAHRASARLRITLAFFRGRGRKELWEVWFITPSAAGCRPGRGGRYSRSHPASLAENPAFYQCAIYSSPSLFSGSQSSREGPKAATLTVAVFFPGSTLCLFPTSEYFCLSGRKIKPISKHFF